MPTTRREFLVRSSALLAVNPAAAWWRDVSAQGSVEPQLLRRTIPVAGLDRRLDGLRIGQLSDVHVGRVVSLDHLERAVALWAGRPPDLLAVTGDLTDVAEDTPACFELINRVRAPYGRFFVMGNHDVWAGRERVLALARAQEGTRALVGEEVDVSIQGARFHVSGVDFPNVGRRGNWKAQLNPAYVEAATQRVGEGDFRLALVHHPDNFDNLAARGVDLALAGHTHGGQVTALQGLFGQFFKYVYGHYRLGGSHLYVSGGTGHWLPVRLGVPAEVTELTLQRV